MIAIFLPPGWESADEVRMFPSETEALEAADAVEVTSVEAVLELVTEGFRSNKLTLRLKLAKSPM